MKIRQGFVSNSSSASYYVTIKGKPNEVLCEIANNCEYPFIYPDDLIEILDKRIKFAKDRIEDIDTKKETFLLETRPNLVANLDKLEKQKETILQIKNERNEKDYNYDHRAEELVRLTLEIHFINVKDDKDSIQLSNATVMHNNYIEGMSWMLQDIVLYYSFENPGRMICKMERDQ